MKFTHRLIILAILTSALLPDARLFAQGDEGNGVSLGDVARALRRDKASDKDQGQKEAPAAQTVIDNDNLSQVMAQAEKDRGKGNINFIFDGIGKDIHVAAPDVTCSLSFSGKSAALVSDPFVPQDIPRDELANLDGPAVLNGEAIQITMHNGTTWNIREITVSLTILRPSAANSAALRIGSARLVPASDGQPSSSGKRSDFTVLYHIKGLAAPGATTVFRQELGGKIEPDQEWHWAIVQAQGIPPK